MKKNLIKKVFAVSLSIAMACSALPAANPVTASAAAPYVSLKTTFKTLKVNQSYKMTLENNKIKWKIKKVETTDKTIATVYGKTTSQVMIKGKSVGRATIRVRLKTSSRKANNTKTLRCRVNVVPAATTTNPTPVQTDAEVKTQAELDAALSNSSITKITINPTTAVNFEIKQNNYPSVDLIVNAPLSDIDNAATFKSITINDIKGDTWTERGTGNIFTLLAKNARMVVEQTASVKGITIGGADSTFNLVVNKGAVQGVNVNAKSTVNITGSAAEGAALIPVTFTAAAADATFTTALPVAVTMSASVTLVFESGAVKSTVKLQVAGIKANITNHTSEVIAVTKNDNTTVNIRAGATNSTVEAVNTTNPTNPGGSSSGGGYNPVTKPTTSATVATAGSLTITGTVTPSAINAANATISDSAIEFTLSGIQAKTSNANDVVEFVITAAGPNNSWIKEVASGTLVKSSQNPTVTENGKVTAVNYADYVGTFNKAQLKDVKCGDVNITVAFKVSATSSYAASATVRATTKGTIASDGTISFESLKW